MNKNVVVVVVSNPNENDKIETYESVVKILQNAAETINKHLKTKPNNVNFLNGSGLLNDGCVIIGGLQNNNNNNEEDGHQNVVVVDDNKEKTGKCLKPNDVAKILTNKNNKIIILEAVTTEKVERNTTDNSDDNVITDENCVAGQDVTNQDDKNKTCTYIEHNKVANLLEKEDNIKNVPYIFTANSNSNATAISSEDLTNDLCGVASSSNLKSNRVVESKVFNFIRKSENYKTFVQNYGTKIITNAFEKMIISVTATEKPQPNSTAISNNSNNCVVADASAVVKQYDNNKLENANKSKNIPYCVTAKSIPNASRSGENGMINSNNEDGHQNVVDNDKEKIYKSFEQDDVTKIFTNKDDKINILEAVTTEKIEPKFTHISSKDLTNDLCTATSSGVKSNQGVKSKVFNIDTKKPWQTSTDVSLKDVNDGCVFTSDRLDVKILRNKYEKLILSNTVFTSDQNDKLRTEFEKQIAINSITKKPLLNSTDVRLKGIKYDYVLTPEEIKEKLKNLFEKLIPNYNSDEKNDVEVLRNKFVNLFSCNTVFTSDQNDLLRNEFEKQIVIKTLKEKPSQSANKAKNVPFFFTAESKSNASTVIGQENKMNNDNNKEDGYQNVLVDDNKEKTYKSLEFLIKILTNEKINISEAVTTEKIEPNRTAIGSKDVTGDLCVASSSGVKSNQGVKSKVFNNDGKNDEKDNVAKRFKILNTVKQAPLQICNDERSNKIGYCFDFTIERYDVKIFRNKFEKLILSNAVFTLEQIAVLRNVFKKQILINTITKKPVLNLTNDLEKLFFFNTVRKTSLPNSTAGISKIINSDIEFSQIEKEYIYVFRQILYDLSHKQIEAADLDDKFKNLFSCNSVFTSEQNAMLLKEIEKQILINFPKTNPIQYIRIRLLNRYILIGANEVLYESGADTTKNLPLFVTADSKSNANTAVSGGNGMNNDNDIDQDKLIQNWAVTNKLQENSIIVTNNKPNLKFIAEFNEPKRIISNIQSFDCKICFNTCEPYDGIILQNCSHSFCLECIRNFIKSYESIIVECPHVNDHKNIKCKEQIKEYEILGILSPKEIEIYRERQFKLNVQSINGFIQCCTINCKGFYINDKGEHFFTCYICKIVNCSACKATHQGMSCRRYKESIDPNLKLSNAYLQNRKLDGLAMDCPSCGAIVERTEGCEGMQCIICKTDLCWATKGLRWGPDGKGDESGGCRCTPDKRCHQTCRNCH